MSAEPDEPVSPSLESARAVRTALGVATGIIALVLGGLAWNVVTSVRNLDAANERHMRLDQLRGTIVHLDEVLTMSARMAAATGDPRWETRYREYEPQLSAALQEALSLAPQVWAVEDIRRTEAANTALVNLENAAFGLVRRNDLKAAGAVLASGEYDRQKTIYSTGMSELDTALDRSAQRAMDGEVQRVRVVLVISAAMLSLLGICWVVAIRAMNRRSAMLVRNHELLLRQAAELVALNTELDQRVEERTGQLRQNIADLESALARVDELHGILPICSYCRKVRSDTDSWHRIEEYVTAHSAARFSHGVCPDCLKNVVEPELEEWLRKERNDS